MLRRYDEIGLLRPCETDPFTGYRYYREDQLLLAGRIRSLQDMGFSLAAVGEMLPCLGDPARMEQFFRIREAELKAEIETASVRLRLLETAGNRLRKDEPLMNISVLVKTIPERTAATLRMTLPSYADEGKAWDILCAETDGLNLIPDDPCLCCIVFHDSEFKESDVDVEIQKTVAGTYPDTEHVRFRTLPAVTAACGIYNGSYDGLDDAIRTVAEWVGANGYEFDGPAFLIYHVSPHETDDPAEFVTEICYPVKLK